LRKSSSIKIIKDIFSYIKNHIIFPLKNNYVTCNICFVYYLDIKFEDIDIRMESGHTIG